MLVSISNVRLSSKNSSGSMSCKWRVRLRLVPSHNSHSLSSRVRHTQKWHALIGDQSTLLDRWTRANLSSLSEGHCARNYNGGGEDSKLTLSRRTSDKREVGTFLSSNQRQTFSTVQWNVQSARKWTLFHHDSSVTRNWLQWKIVELVRSVETLAQHSPLCVWWTMSHTAIRI
jgi:hypothetical protein